MGTIEIYNRITVSPAEACILLGVSRPTIYEMMHEHDFPSFKQGARTLIPVEDLKAWASKRARAEAEANG